ncbi:U3 small nucleolar RNA-associated protein 6-domain-containing protein [Terfezia claveryi]|nr:U3 small nucleolar RNA-associated protein 6-domain-containing protein [Terfezia claveryi]
MADKARYYLEQSIPELKEFEKKKIFTKAEISAITKKRSEFEHKVNAPGCKSIDYVRYAEYEMNLEALRRKRVHRLGIKSKSHLGQRKIFFVLDRATRKFHGDIGLWMQYIEFAKKEGASKVLLKVFASALKLHPMRAELWIYAARHAMDENGDMTEARSFMQRGLRFNKGSRQLWLEYTKLELVYVAKIITRRLLLGIDGLVEAQQQRIEDENMMELPIITAEEANLRLNNGSDIDNSPLNNIENNSALNGTIPLAVFDAAVQEISNDVEFVFSFFNLFGTFPNLPCLSKLLDHVISHALSTYPTSPLALFMDVNAPILGVEPTNPSFPSKVGTMLSKIASHIGEASPRIKLYQLVTSCLQEILDAENLDPAVDTVIKSALSKYFKQAETGGDIDANMYLTWAKVLESNRKPKAAQLVRTRGREAFPNTAIVLK